MKDLFMSLFSILSFLSIAAAAASDRSLVLDVDGDPLQPGVKYYASYIIWPTNGGVSMASTANRICPSSVIQRVVWETDPDKGDPIVFHLKNSTEEGGIHVSSDLYIEFPDTVTNDACPDESNVWMINWDWLLEQKFDISVGGAVGNPASVFQIEAVGTNWYKFVYCFAGLAPCKSVGRTSHDGLMRLVLDDNSPFVVFFSKVVRPLPPVIQLPKSLKDSICPPGKSSWPELVGMRGTKAVEIIEKENSNVKATILRPGQVKPGNFVCGRVFVVVNLFGFVIVTPRIG